MRTHLLLGPPLKSGLTPPPVLLDHHACCPVSSKLEYFCVGWLTQAAQDVVSVQARMSTHCQSKPTNLAQYISSCGPLNRKVRWLGSSPTPRVLRQIIKVTSATIFCRGPLAFWKWREIEPCVGVSDRGMGFYLKDGRWWLIWI